MAGPWTEAIKAQIAANPERFEFLNPEHTGRFIGRKGNEGFAYWDPSANEYRRVTMDQKRDLGKMHTYINDYGDMVYGLRPDDWYTGMVNGEEIYYEGKDPFAGSGTIRNPDGISSPVPGDWERDPNFDWDNTTKFQPKPDNIPIGFPDDQGNVNYPVNTPTGDPFDWIPGNTDTSWDWSQGGDDPWAFTGIGGPAAVPDYDFGNRPGMGSPWGQTGSGGNQEFYSRQLGNLLSQQDAYQQAEQEAAQRRTQGLSGAFEGDPWAWAYGGKGLPTVQTVGGTADSPTVYQLRGGIIPGQTTNAEIMRMAQTAGIVPVHENYPIRDDDASWNSSGTTWSEASNPQQLFGLIASNADQNWRDALRGGMNYAFRNQALETPSGGGPTAAPGYALPRGTYGG